MADLPINSVSVDMSSIKNVSISPSKDLQQAAPSSTSKILDHNVIASQILSKTPNELVLSLPNQPALRIDISNNTALIQQLNIGDKVTLTIAHDNKTAVITITQQAPKPTVELTLPLSQSLSSALNRDTSLPAKESLIQSHIEKNGALLLGQARRLPQEQITLKVSESITLKAQLMGVNALPHNKTMQASLILSNDKQLLVQFSTRPIPLPSIQIVVPLKQLTANNPATLLHNLPVTNVVNIDEVLDPIASSSIQPKKTDVIDMSKPLNQLWLRHQPVTKVLGILSNALQEVSTLNRDQIKSELSLQQTILNSTVMSKLIDTTLIKDTALVNNSASILKSITNGALSNAVVDSKALIEPKALTTSGHDSSAKQTNVSTSPVTPISLKELGQSLTNAQPTEILLERSQKLSKELTTEGSKELSKEIRDVVTKDSKATPETASKQTVNNSEKITSSAVDGKTTATIKESTTPNAQKETLLTTPENKKPPLNTDILKSITQSESIKPQSKTNELFAASIAQAKAPQPLSAQASPTPIAQTPDIKTVMSDIKPSLDKVILEKMTPEQSPSISLQKLNALISALHSSTNHASTNATKETNQSDKIPLKNHSTSETFDDELVAIDQLKNLSQRLNKQLPAMSQLTNPAQLSQLVEQFTRFEPLSTASINLSSLGPLASALQLMLGGRQAAQNQPLSPQLIKHLSQLLKNTRGGSASNLTSALQMLGNLQSFKPLEDALTNISSNIQFYQYQNVDQQQNNQSLFYFNLPTKEPQLPQVEGEVEQQQSNDPNGEKSWRLTLLLPCGDNDKIKVNALLTGNSVELDLTCNNQSLVDRANFYKNFLGSRLEALGFEKPTVSCQQGEIPATLLKRPNQLVELMI